MLGHYASTPSSSHPSQSPPHPLSFPALHSAACPGAPPSSTPVSCAAHMSTAASSHRSHRLLPDYFRHVLTSLVPLHPPQIRRHDSDNPRSLAQDLQVPTWVANPPMFQGASNACLTAQSIGSGARGMEMTIFDPTSGVWMSWLQTRFSPIFLSGGVYLVMIYYGVMMVFVVVIVDCMCPSF